MELTLEALKAKVDNGKQTDKVRLGKDSLALSIGCENDLVEDMMYNKREVYHGEFDMENKASIIDMLKEKIRNITNHDETLQPLNV